MAIIKELSDDVGRISSYHNIHTVKFDFVLGKIIIELNNYSTEDMREVQKQEEIDNQTKIDRYYELLSKDTRTDEEKNFCAGYIPLPDLKNTLSNAILASERYEYLLNKETNNPEELTEDEIIEFNDLKSIGINKINEQISELTNIISKYEAIDAKNTMTHEEREEFSKLNIMELEAWKINKTNMSTRVYKLDIKDIDYRDIVYPRLMEEIPDLAGSSII